jgi:YggT family protein
MAAMFYLINTLFGLYLMVVLLRLWLQLARADFYNPFSQFIVKATHPILAPLRRILPSVGKVDTATVLLAFAVSMLQIVVISSLFISEIPNLITLIVTASANLLKEALNLLFWMLILRAILSWVSQGQSPIEYVLGQLTEPLMAPVRRLIPPLGGLDLSVLVIIIAVQFVQFLLKDLFPFLSYF